MLDTGGGHIDPDLHQTLSVPDPFRAISAEICAEFGIEPDELIDLRLLGLARHRPGDKPELLFRTRSSLPSSALPGRLAAAVEAFETASFEAIPGKDARSTLESRSSELTSSGQAALWFYAAARDDPARC